MSTVAVIGTVTRDAGFHPGWWGSAAATWAPPTTADPTWSVAAVDQNDQVLVTAPVAITEVPCSPDGPTFRLKAAVPLPDAAACIVVRHDGAEIYRRVVPPPAEVHLDIGADRIPLPRAPLEVLVRITGTTQDGAHLIAYWETPTQPPLPLGLIDVGGGAPPVVTVDLGALPGGEECRLRVVYSDGVRTTEVVSGPLTVAPRPARPVIEAPTAEHTMPEHGWLSLRGRLDGDGDPDALQWLLDDTVIGHGPRAGYARPGAGSHTLILRHGEESVSIPLTVTAALQPMTPPTWQPPWRSRPLTVYGQPARIRRFGEESR